MENWTKDFSDNIKWFNTQSVSEENREEKIFEIIRNNKPKVSQICWKAEIYRFKMLCQHQLDTNIKMHQTAEPKIKKNLQNSKRKIMHYILGNRMELRSEFLSEFMEARKKVGKCLYSTGRRKMI